jgi:hypothetical protein
MPGAVLLALAQWAGQTVAAAAITDVWGSLPDTSSPGCWAAATRGRPSWHWPDER